MKKIQLYRIVLLTMLAAVVLTSCRFEDDDIFNESAALRIEHQGVDIDNLLTSAPNGWVMQYFCASDVAQFEGFNLFATFNKSGKVTMAGDHRYLRDGNAGKYTEASSVYEIVKEEGLVLAFDVWNDVLSPFSDPVAYWLAPDNLYWGGLFIGTDGVGMHGDHNFVVKSFNDNEINLRGERYQAAVRLVKLDRDAKTYIADTKALKEKIWSDLIHSYYVVSGSETLFLDNAKVSNKHDGVFRYCDDLDITKAVKADSVSFVFTPKGIRFENPLKIGSSTFQEMTLADDNSALVNEDGTVKLTAIWDRDVADRNTIWYVDLDNLSDDLKQLVNELDAAFTAANKNNSLAAIGIGKTTNANNVTGLVVKWYTTTRKTTMKMGGVSFKRTTPAYGQLAITCDDEPTVDNEMNTKAPEVVAAARKLAKAFVGTYNLTPESYFIPSPVSAVSVDGAKKFSLVTK